MKQILLALIENSQQYTLAVADAMPVTGDDIRPTEKVFSFREQLHHIGYGIGWWVENFVREIQTEWDPPAMAGDRAQVKDYIQRQYRYLRDTIQATDLNDGRIKGFFATLDHITHHRGQMIVYLRMQGINPPDYLF